MFCAATGFAGTPKVGTGRFEPDRLVPVENAVRIKVHFNADRSEQLPWTFKPQQKYVNVLPGETSLAFYTAKNNSNKDIIGIATYNVTPDRVSDLSIFHFFAVRSNLIGRVFSSKKGRSIFFQSRMFLFRRTTTSRRRRSRYATPVLHRQRYPRRSCL